MNGQDGRDEFEARVRDALRRDGERIRPHDDGLALIRERTAARHPAGRNWLMAGAIGLATATAIAGAFFVSTDLLDRSAAPEPAAPTLAPAESESPTPSPAVDPSPSPTEGSPSSEPSPGSPTPARPKPSTVPVYYVGETTNGPRLFREFHQVEAAESRAVLALNEMFGTAPDDPDYSSRWPQGTRALSVSHAGGAITVDLSREVLDTSVPPETADLMVQQLVYTVTAALQSTDPVRILVGGEPVPEISGSPTGDGLTRAPKLDVQAMTWIISPSQGATVAPTFTVEGVANAFEGTVLWELVRGGEVVRDGFTTTAEGQTFASYQFRITDVPAGDYTLRVFQESAKDGSATFVDTKDITVE